MDVEKTYYNSNGVMITNRRVVTADQTTIAISQVNFVKTEQREEVKPNGLGCGVIILGFVLGGAIGNDVGGGIMFILSLIGMIMMLVPQKKIYFQFHIQTSSTGTVGYESEHRAIIDKMVGALNQAIVENLEKKENSSPTIPQNQNTDKISQLSKLAEMRKSGILSEEEFQSEKRKILNKD
jgi:hypothetical protein